VPIRDWSRVPAAIFHDFHQDLIIQIKRDLNAGVQPKGYYAMAEQVAGGLGPDVLALHKPQPTADESTNGGARSAGSGAGRTGTLLAPPKVRIVAETDQEYYRRKQSIVAIRHVSGHRVVAVVEVVSPGNKSGRQAVEQIIRNASEFLDQGIHLLIVDLLPPGRFDPNGIHGAIWEYIAGQDFVPPADKPLTVAAYESDLVTRAYVEPVAVGDPLPDMPLFLEPRQWVPTPLERSYRATWDTLPLPLKEMIEGEG
jgi:Protein of unknown function (DUF4058)